jgi:DNA polymerase V
VAEEDVPEKEAWVQLDIFTDYAALEAQQKKEKADLARERNRQEAILQIRRRFGKNAIIRGMSLEEGATAIQRNGQIGGHKA